MRVKRFTGDSVTDTMRKIKRELGPEAVILQTRQIKEGGLLGFFSRTRIEITAAVEDKPAVTASITGEESKPAVSTDLIKKAYEDYRDKENESFRNMDTSEKMLENTQTELKQMHNILQEIKGHLAKREENEDIIPQPLEKWLEYLINRGISQETAGSLLSFLKSDLKEEDWRNESFVFEKIKKRVTEICASTETIRPIKSKALVVALIGPTGVGKTTTIGKLAAGFSIIERRKVALITADTYRVAAVEQLKTFGEIIGVPVEVVMTPAGLKESVERHEDKELIFIDTAGRSPHHDLHMSELEAFLQQANPDLTMLVMSVTTNLSDQIMVFERFKKLSSHLIFTKLDESWHKGSLLDLVQKTKLPVAYLTNGQNVPDDIDAATPEKLARYILGEGTPNV